MVNMVALSVASLSVFVNASWEDRRGSTEEQQQQQKAAVRHTVDTPGSVATDGAS
jgi:hypothetical protein